MISLLTSIVKSLGKDLGKIVVLIVGAVKSLVSFMQDKLQYKKEKDLKKELEKKDKEIDEVCNNGTLDDLFDLRAPSPKILTFLAILLAFTGCQTTQIQIQSVKAWEGHYMSVDQFKEKTKDISLDKGESIWVLSNRSLSRVLKDKERKENE